MIHPLCKQCIQRCKQDSRVTVIYCPKFQRVHSETEFRGLTDKLIAMEDEANEIKKRTHRLMEKALSGENSTTNDG